MEIVLPEITVSELTDGYKDDKETGNSEKIRIHVLKITHNQKFEDLNL